MRNIILFDDEQRDQLLPLSLTRPVALMRIGILTITEKWEKYLDAEASFITQDYLSSKYEINIEADNYIINGRLLPNEKMVAHILALKEDEALLCKDELIAARMSKEQFNHLLEKDELDHLSGKEMTDEAEDIEMISWPEEIFSKNGQEIEKDFKLLTTGRHSAKANPTNTLINEENIFIEEGAKLSCAILNASTGPIYVGKNAEIMEGAVVRGPLAMLDNSVLKMAAKIYGPTTLGPYCKVGGELNNVVMTGYSSKAHDGFLGNSVIGEWCNLGADTNNSNLKNNYAEVKLWDYTTERFRKTGLQFCGLIMGDHSKCGINTMFNTGTVVGVASNIFGSGFPRNFIPSFSWGGASGFTTYKMNKVVEVAEIVLKRRGKTLGQEDQDILEAISKQTSKYRPWEKEQ